MTGCFLVDLWMAWLNVKSMRAASFMSISFFMLFKQMRRLPEDFWRLVICNPTLFLLRALLRVMNKINGVYDEEVVETWNMKVTMRA
jgi:hypothetical protein